MQGQPSGEAFIQMDSEEAARASAQQKHNKFMMFGKKYRYIEVFQCSGDDMNLVLNGGLQTPPNPPKPPILSPGMLPQTSQATQSSPSPGLPMTIPPPLTLSITPPTAAASFLAQQQAQLIAQQNLLARQQALNASNVALVNQTQNHVQNQASVAAAVAAADQSQYYLIPSPGSVPGQGHLTLSHLSGASASHANSGAAAAAAAAATASYESGVNQLHHSHHHHARRQLTEAPPGRPCNFLPQIHHPNHSHHQPSVAAAAPYPFMLRHGLHSSNFQAQINHQMNMAGYLPPQFHPSLTLLQTPMPSHMHAAAAAAQHHQQQTHPTSAALAAAQVATSLATTAHHPYQMPTVSFATANMMQAQAASFKRSYGAAFEHDPLSAMDARLPAAAKRFLTRQPIYAPYFPPGL